MTQPKAIPEFDPIEYERPTGAWVCGWASEGRPCRIGPDSGGRCLATFECTPFRNGDRWQCTRSKLAGGKCPDGPLPDGTCCRPIPKCQPVRSLRARRGVLVRSLIALTLGGVLIATAEPFRETLLSPGELTFAHSSIDAGCSACHSAAEQDLIGWVQHGLLGDAGSKDSRLCTACHRFGEFGFHPHKMDPEELSRLTEDAKGAGTASPVTFIQRLAELGPGLRETVDGQLACATCHQEHRGKIFDLTHMGQTRCQACHVKKFAGFVEGHSEFADYPHARRSRIYFNHASHLGRHFHESSSASREAAAQESCTDCHTPDLAGHSMELRGFEQTCAGCHQHQIEDDLLPGIAFFALPSLDLETLVEKQIAVGQWPVWTYGKLTPFLDTLLASDPEFDEFRSVVSELNLSDLRSADAAELRAVEQFAWAMKRLVHDLSQHGMEGMAARTGNIDSRGLLVRLPSPEVMRVAGEAWFPELVTEMASRQSGEAVLCQPVEPTAAESSTRREEFPGEPSGLLAGWYYDRSQKAVSYRPTGHADAFLRRYLDLSAKHDTDKRWSELKPVFNALSNRFEAGRCTKCHTIDRQEDHSLRVNWHAAAPVPNDHPFTKFSHQPHLNLLGASKCTDCHKLNSHGGFRAAFILADESLSLSPASPCSNFSPFRKADCARCHSGRRAGDSCLTCHNYHVGEIGPTAGALASERKNGF